MTTITNNTINLIAPGAMPKIGMGAPAHPLGGFAGGLADIFSGLARALQALADQLGGGGDSAGKPQGGGASVPTPAGGKPIAGTARIWGDPHFIGADGDMFDVQGEAGKTYNLLSDKGFQMNGTFEKYGDEGATIVGKVGITAGSNYVQVDKSGAASINGQALHEGQRIALRDGGFAEKKNGEITVSKGEWEVKFQTSDGYINMDIKTENAIADGVKPQGLIGQTFDGDGKALTGDAGSGAQGGGAIRHADGSLSKAGDKEAVKSYEVSALWDTTFHSHNSDNGQSVAFWEETRQGAAQFAMMMGFSTLFNSLFSANSGTMFGNYRTA